ncbi:hypothetical protein BJ508DRAFT_379593 [Ascobolus immersus RN42]|uniref:Uncharacterized protein n=1 Tax=Ascobolus immersus RN42 TaxID=1160509 RepID=A0A3N4HW38_ASCIM|nr:hypothetical protein BJ508DRAFT_379593 [Ascobolus immersus RN42]
MPKPRKSQQSKAKNWVTKIPGKPGKENIKVTDYEKWPWKWAKNRRMSKQKKATPKGSNQPSPSEKQQRQSEAEPESPPHAQSSRAQDEPASSSNSDSIGASIPAQEIPDDVSVDTPHDRASSRHAVKRKRTEVETSTSSSSSNSQEPYKSVSSAGDSGQASKRTSGDSGQASKKTSGDKSLEDTWEPGIETQYYASGTAPSESTARLGDLSTSTAPSKSGVQIQHGDSSNSTTSVQQNQQHLRWPPPRTSTEWFWDGSWTKVQTKFKNKKGLMAQLLHPLLRPLFLVVPFSLFALFNCFGYQEVGGYADNGQTTEEGLDSNGTSTTTACISRLERKADQRIRELQGQADKKDAEYANLKAKFEALQSQLFEKEGEIRQYRNKINQQEYELQTKDEEMRQVQEAELLKAKLRKSPISKNHEEVQAALTDLFSAVKNWTRSEFRGQGTEGWPVANVCSMAPKFSELLSNCTYDLTSLFSARKKFKLSFLMEAVVNQFLTDDILMNPFSAFEPHSPEVAMKLVHLYDNLKNKSEPRASKWRALTLDAIQGPKITDEKKGDPHFHAMALLGILEPLLRAIDREVTEEMFATCKDFIASALIISRTINLSSAGLKCIDRSFFQDGSWLYQHGREEYKSRLGGELDDDCMVQLITRPGFFKCGDDNGDDFHLTACWIRAEVETCSMASFIETTRVETSSVQPGSNEERGVEPVNDSAQEPVSYCTQQNQQYSHCGTEPMTDFSIDASGPPPMAKTTSGGSDLNGLAIVDYPVTAQPALPPRTAHAGSMENSEPLSPPFIQTNNQASKQHSVGLDRSVDSESGELFQCMIKETSDGGVPLQQGFATEQYAAPMDLSTAPFDFSSGPPPDPARIYNFPAQLEESQNGTRNSTPISDSEWMTVGHDEVGQHNKNSEEMDEEMEDSEDRKHRGDK